MPATFAPATVFPEREDISIFAAISSADTRPLDRLAGVWAGGALRDADTELLGRSRHRPRFGRKAPLQKTQAVHRAAIRENRATAVSVNRELPARAAEFDAARALARTRFYRERFPDFWYDVEGREYALYDVAAMEQREIERIRAAAADAWRIFVRVAPILRGLPDEELLAIGVPRAALHVCRLSEPNACESVVARFDFALT